MPSKVAKLNISFVINDCQERGEKHEHDFRTISCIVVGTEIGVS
jgi:hypothetical protein